MSKYLIILLALLAGALVFTGCSDDCDDTTTPPVNIPQLDFAGSDKCMGCHAENYDKWVVSGHPYKLTKIDGESPVLKFPDHAAFPNDIVVPPGGLTWDDISYTIGGYGWKMRWIDKDGFIVTVPSNQYNFETETWSDYHSDETPGSKEYNTDCGRCHTTGWVDSDDGDDTNNQDGMKGMPGTFFAGGVHCEQCHGMGSQHVAANADFRMTVDARSYFCGTCHTRDPGNQIAFDSGRGFIKHHEQYDEWLHSPHNSDARGTGCNDCHDPHSSVKFDDVLPSIGTTKTCTDCHSIAAGGDQDYDGDSLKHKVPIDCIMCHMPKASRSAINLTDYVGDIRTHIFSINTAAVGKTEGMFEGDFVAVDENDQASVTLDFACYSCHSDGNGGGGEGIPWTLQELSDFVTGADGKGSIHNPQKKTLASR
jgi:predicted CXXCH cytochrome family protein